MIDLDDIRRAREAIADGVYLSPLAHSETLSRMASAPVHLKLENLQMTGSFKERGALNRLQGLSEAERAAGVVASSAGNHAQAVAYLARRLGVKATIVMPEPAPLTKVSRTRAFGAEVILHGESYADAYTRAVELQAQRGLTFVHPYDDPAVVAGQGTIGLELLEQSPDLQLVVVPVGGGGLVSGIATAIKGLRPEVEVVGVEAAAYPSAQRSLVRGYVEPCGDEATLADGIAVRQVGELPFALMQRYVDAVVTVSEEEIASSVLVLLEHEKTVAEGAGAVALAAVLDGKIDVRSRRTACVVSGGNIDVNILSKIIERGLSRDGRRVRLTVEVPDRPGSLSRVTALIARVRANVLEVFHERAFSAGPVGTTTVRFTLETRGPEHVQEVRDLLASEGFVAEEERRGA